MSSFLVIFQHCERWDSQEKKWMETGKTEELIFHPSSRRLASTISSTATIFFFFCAKYFGLWNFDNKKDALFKAAELRKNPLNLSRENVISFCLELTLHQSISHTFFSSKKIYQRVTFYFKAKEETIWPESYRFLRTSRRRKKVGTFPENASPWIYGGSTLAKLLRFMMSRLKEKIQLPKNHLRRKREKNQWMKNGNLDF